MCTCHNYNPATKQFEPCPRYLDSYGCVRCQSYHYAGDELFTPHLLSQSKHGITKRLNPKRRDLDRLVALELRP